jgi:hypothetical protein
MPAVVGDARPCTDPGDVRIVREQHDDHIYWRAETPQAPRTPDTPPSSDDDPTIRIRRPSPSIVPPPVPPSTFLPSSAPLPRATPPPLLLHSASPAYPQAPQGALGSGRRTRARRGRHVRRVIVGIVAVVAVFSGLLFALGNAGNALVGAGRYAGPAAQTATSTPVPTPTATLVPLPDFGLPSMCGTAAGASQAGCVQCPYTYDQTQYTKAQVQTALDAAAEQYNLPRALVYAIAWGESNWHSGFITCNYDLGVMQLKQGYLATFDNLHEPAAWCPGIERTLYDPIGSMQENVLLGAKWLAWLQCYYGWMASRGGSRTAPDTDTLAWYYRQAGKPLPDTSASASLCAATAQDPTKPWFKDMGVDATNLWSCPFSAKAGDRTFLDVVIAAYNAGPQALDGSIPNDGYVSYIEGIMTQFVQGQLPV